MFSAGKKLTMKKRTFSGTTNPGVTPRETAHRKIAREAAAEGIVLLKNEGNLLPLSVDRPVALYGVGASRTIKGGTGSGDVNERESVSIYQGMKNAGYRVTTEDWIRDYDGRYQKAREAWRDDILSRAGDKKTMDFFAVYSTTPFVVPEGAEISKTGADTAIYVISRVAGEGADRYCREGDYLLTAWEKKHLAQVCSLYEHVIVAVNTGGLIDLSFLDEFPEIGALLYVTQPGMEGGNAFADVLSGAVTPSGKLTDSWAYRYEDYPSSAKYSHNNGNVEKEYYEDGIFVGYRYFDTFEVPVRYGFGFGLSYTGFSVEFTGLRADEENARLAVTARVTNTGEKYGGREVVQLYVTPPAGVLAREYRRLIAFAKTGLLAPGETQELDLSAPFSLLASYDAEAPGWLMEAGPYVLWLGNSLEACRPAAILGLDEDVYLTKTGHICPLREKLTEILPDGARTMARLDSLMEEAREKTLPVRALRAQAIPVETVAYRDNRELAPKEAREFVDCLSMEQLIALSGGDPGKAQGGNLGAAGISVPGSAGETSTCAEDENLPGIVLADGPAGLRLMKYYNVSEGKIVSKPFQFSLEGGLFCQNLPEDPGERRYQYCTAIPVGVHLAQTWDTALVERVGEMIGREMEEFGVTLWLAPGMNIHRNPLCGRNFEYYSEDPLVAGRMAGAMTGGVQRNPGCGTTIKHFACNNMEDNRKHADSIVSERALREIYLRGFEIAVKEAQPMAIMTSYNLINGVHAANCGDLCTRAARCEWGFKGLIMTDWTTTEDGEDCTASGCMRAGNDLVMPGAACDRENLNRELAAGTLDPEDVKACIARLVNIIWQSNRYEGAVPYSYRTER